MFLVMSDVYPPFRQSTSTDMFQRPHVTVFRNCVCCRGLASAIIESRVTAFATTSLGARRRHGLPSAPVPTTTFPLASVVFTQLKRRLPQIIVGRVPRAMRFRPYDDPNDPGTANAGTRNWSTFCTFAWNVVRNDHS